MKTKSQHTPGPWCIDAAEANETHESIGVIRDNEDGEGVAEIPLSRMADARLIAAAPDLLAALKGMMVHFDNAYCGMTITVHHDDTFVCSEETPCPECRKVVAARAAIAKAEGAECRSCGNPCQQDAGFCAPCLDSGV